MSHILHHIAKNAFNNAAKLEASIGLIEEQARDLYNLFTNCGWQIKLKTKIQGYVETRWTSRQNLFKSIRNNLQEISEILEQNDLLEYYEEVRNLPDLEKIIKLLDPLDTMIKQSQAENATLDNTLTILQTLEHFYAENSDDSECNISDAFKEEARKQIKTRLIDGGLSPNPTLKQMNDMDQFDLHKMVRKCKSFNHLKFNDEHQFIDVLLNLVRFECKKTKIVADIMSKQKKNKMCVLVFKCHTVIDFCKTSMHMNSQRILTLSLDGFLSS